MKTRNLVYRMTSNEMRLVKINNNKKILIGLLVIASLAGGNGGGAERLYVSQDSPATTSATELLATFNNPSPDEHDAFGYSVAMSDRYLVIGTDVHNTEAAEPGGAAYVYDLASATPTTPLITLTNPSPGFGVFGYSVAISGTYVVVGAPFAADGGRAYVYNLASATPSIPEATLDNPNARLYGRFGISVAISGTRAVIGDPGHDRPGSVYVYDVASATSTVPVATLNNPNPAGAGFGGNVAVSGARVVVNGFYVYDLNSATPTTPAVTFASRPGGNAAISGTRVVVGHVRHEGAPGPRPILEEPGRVSVYDLASPIPSEPVMTLNNPAGPRPDYFAFSVAISGSRVVVGAYFHEFDASGRPGAGSAYIYDLASATPTVPATTITNPSPATIDQFGYSVAVSGTRVLVGATHDDTGAFDAGSAYLYDFSTAPVVAPSGPRLPPVLLHSLFNPAITVQSGVLQGHSVAIDGDIVVVGIPRVPGADDVQEGNTGAVKVYDATTGGLLHTLKNPTPPPPPKLPRTSPDFYPDPYDNFGHSVGISGTLIVVGAPFDRLPSGPTAYTGELDRHAVYRDAGTAYIYDLASINPTEPVAALESPEPEAEQHFGYSVAISGANLVVGAPNDNGVGSIYVYDLSTLLPTPVPVLVATINNPNPPAGGAFGYSVALSGAAAAVGAPSGWTNAGTVYVYDIGDRFTREVPVAILTNPDPANNDGFGSCVAITSTRVLVGAPYDDTVALDGGSGYVYEYSLGRTTPAILIASLTSPAPAASELFAYSVSASDEVLAVGTYSAESTYIYDFASLTPTSPAATLSSPTPATNDGFGHSVAVCGTRVVVGAPYDDTRALDAGSAYLFDLAGPAPTTAVATMDDPTLGTGGNAGKSVAVSGNTVVVAAATGTYIYDVASSTPAAPVVTLNAYGGSVAVAGTLVVIGVPSENATHVYDVANATPTEPIIILTNPAVAGSFGSSVAISGTQIAVGAPGGGPGSVYVYDLISVTPGLPVVTLDNPAGHPSFGWSVSLSDTRVVVGAPTDDKGRAYVYHLASATPAVPVATCTNPLSTLTSRYFGWSVSVSGTRVVVGAPQGAEGDPGVAHVYDLESATPATPITTLNNPNPARQGLDRNPDMFGYSVAISGPLVVVGTPYEAMQADSAGVAYVYDLASLTPTTAATVFNPSPGALDVFGWAVAVDGSNIVVGVPYDDTNARDRGAAYVFRSINE